MSNSRILIVEDDFTNIAVIKHYIKNNYSVDIAYQAEEAVEKVKKAKYDAILMDIRLKGNRDGISLMKEIRKIEYYKECPIAAITGYSFREDRERFLSEGFSNYLSKPFNKKELENLLEEMTGYLPVLK